MSLLMKNLLCFLIMTIMSNDLMAQQLVIQYDSVQRSLDVRGRSNGAEIQLPMTKVFPSFPGGKEAWYAFLLKHFNKKIPFAQNIKPGTYSVYVRFLVQSNGKLNSIGADSNVGYGLESELLRCIQLSPVWNPAETASGRKVAFTIRQVVTFVVKSNDLQIVFGK